MANCNRCYGEGYNDWEEDGRQVRDACYHCGATGQISEEEDFQDQLLSVAGRLALQEESGYKRAVNDDPDGDGYDLYAAENMMSSYDYFTARVYERQGEIAEKLSELDRASQELLVVWN